MGPEGTESVPNVDLGTAAEAKAIACGVCPNAPSFIGERQQKRAQLLAECFNVPSFIGERQQKRKQLLA